MDRSPMKPEQVVAALRWMILSRAIDERLTKLQRLGRVGLYGPVHGQEAAAVGSAMALDNSRDWIVPASREQPAMLIHGLPLRNMFAGYMGGIDAAVIPSGVNLLPRQQSIAAQLPHAVGLAWAMKLRRVSAAVLVYFGEGASSEGDFHEACNLAGVIRAPVVFVLMNNGYAISTPARQQSGAEDLSVRAAGYGFAGIAVDGNDVLAVYSATVDAVGRALAGGGPTLIECRTYRVGFHNTSDNPKEYRDEAEVQAAVRLDPIDRTRRLAISSGWWSEEHEAGVTAEIRSEIDVAQKFVEGLPRPDARAIFEHVYSQIPGRLAAQLAETIAPDV